MVFHGFKGLQTVGCGDNFMAGIYERPRYEFTYGGIIFGDQDFCHVFSNRVLWIHARNLFGIGFQSMNKSKNERDPSVVAHHANIRKTSEQMSHINAIANNKNVIDRKPHIICLDTHFALFVFVEQYAGMDGGGAARRH